VSGVESRPPAADTEVPGGGAQFDVRFVFGVDREADLGDQTERSVVAAPSTFRPNGNVESRKWWGGLVSRIDAEARKWSGSTGVI